MPLPYNKDHKERSRDLRNSMTPAEQLLWSRIRKKQILGLQFYRQKPIHQYIVDFYCPKASLVVEVDGGQHWEPDHAEADHQRDKVLEQLNLKVLRFSNLEVLKQLDSVVEQIYEIASQRLERYSD
ncbi:MAG: endonuclease domain-containing protein [Acidobacteriota bacterium]